MNGLRLVRPSAGRVLWSIITATAACCVIAGVFLYGVAIATHSDTEAPPKGEYVRLFVLDITLWGPIFVLTLWKLTIPLMIGLGWLAAAVRRTPAPPPQIQS